MSKRKRNTTSARVRNKTLKVIKRHTNPQTEQIDVIDKAVFMYDKTLRLKRWHMAISIVGTLVAFYAGGLIAATILLSI